MRIACCHSEKGAIAGKIGKCPAFVDCYFWKDRKNRTRLLGDWSAGMKSLGEYTEWYSLFDDLCNSHGFQNNADLASQFCACDGRSSQADFEAARKKLKSWRAGQRLPRHGNFITLAEILDLEQHPDLRERWDSLYRMASARGVGTTRDGIVQQFFSPAFSKSQRLALRRWTAVGAVPLLGVSLLAAVIDHDRAVSGDLPEVGYNAFVSVPVGTSQLIHGEYDDCDGPPPDWRQVEAKVPVTRLGVFADGGLARKMVNDCGKEMVVRAVMFTGIETGVEELRLLDDYMRIEVQDHP
jgi:hypothetical protein